MMMPTQTSGWRPNRLPRMSANVLRCSLFRVSRISSTLLSGSLSPVTRFSTPAALPYSPLSTR